MYQVEETMDITLFWLNRNNNTFDNLDYKPQNHVKDLSELLDII